MGNYWSGSVAAGGDEQGRVIAARPFAAIAIACSLSLPLLLAACRPPPAARLPVAAPQAPAGGSRFRVDAAASQMRFYLHADGPLARVGHSHLISARGIEGDVWLQPRPERSSCELRLPVAEFVVDDPAERAAAGNEYAEPLDAADRDGTRTHMLGERQLDATHYPMIALRCLRLTPAPGGMSLELAVTLRGRAAQLTVPLRWERQDETLRASGEFSFRQSELGLEPYSLLLGALRVADEIHARFVLVARQSGATPRG
jgi:polyisoprenoid-binding protein YceI